MGLQRSTTEKRPPEKDYQHYQDFELYVHNGKGKICARGKEDQRGGGQDLMVLGAIVLIRTVISYSLNAELKSEHQSTGT